VGSPLHAGDGDDLRPSGQHPGQGDLGGRPAWAWAIRWPFWSRGTPCGPSGACSPAGCAA
jgi:hypothetical protein